MFIAISRSASDFVPTELAADLAVNHRFSTSGDD